MYFADNLPKKQIDQAVSAQLSAIRGVLDANPIDARITLSGYEGSELIVARPLIERGADVRYVGTACAKSDWSAHDCEWLESRGVSVKFRASLEDDLYAMDTYEPDIAIGTTPVVQHAKELSILEAMENFLANQHHLVHRLGVFDPHGEIHRIISQSDIIKFLQIFVSDRQIQIIDNFNGIVFFITDFVKELFLEHDVKSSSEKVLECVPIFSPNCKAILGNFKDNVHDK